MASNNLNQYHHNKEFLKKLCDSFPDSYFDWKVTVLFYCVTHIVRAHAQMIGITIGNSHTDVHDYIINLTGSDKSNEYKDFRTIYRNSRDCRYNGFTNQENFDRISKIKYEESKSLLNSYKIFFENKGLNFTINSAVGN